jgi:hypothetical protein
MAANISGPSPHKTLAEPVLFVSFCIETKYELIVGPNAPTKTSDRRSPKTIPGPIEEPFKVFILSN